jgi:serine/threonine protein phosphatase PrpC
MVEEQTIYDVIINDFENSDRILIDKANEAGGSDNITVVIIKN